MNQIVPLPAPSQPLLVSPLPEPTPAGPTKGLYKYRTDLRARFLASGHEATPDHELLEMLLFGAITQHDTRPVCWDLLDHFDGLSGVLTASPEQLRKVKNVGDNMIATIKLAEALAARLARAKILNRHIISSWDALLDYCHTTMAHREVEHLRVLFLDRKNRLIADEELAQGTVDHVQVYPREVLRKALEHNASAFILVHNHPTGDATPSKSDIAMTERIQEAADALSLAMHDHLIIGRSEEFSFRSEGLL